MNVNKFCPLCLVEVEIEVAVIGKDRPASRECPPEYAELEVQTTECPECKQPFPEEFITLVEKAAAERAREPIEPVGWGDG